MSYTVQYFFQNSEILFHIQRTAVGYRNYYTHCDGFAPYVIVPSMNWNEIYKITCKLDMSMTTIKITQSHSKTTEILRELRQKYKFT